MSDSSELNFVRGQLAEAAKQRADVLVALQRLIDQNSASASQNEELAKNVARFNHALYDPENGLFTRVKEISDWMHSQRQIVKWMFTSGVGVALATWALYHKIKELIVSWSH
jgi:hypothetical protein